jgi:hypothetical protein
LAPKEPTSISSSSARRPRTRILPR